MKSPLLKRALLAIAILVLLLIVTSPVTMIWLIQRQAARIVEDSLKGLTTSSLATMNVSEGFLQTAYAISSNSKEKLPDILFRLEEATREVDIQYEAHRASLRSDNERLEFERLLEAKLAYRATRQKVLELVGANKRDEAQELFEKECERKFEIYMDRLGHVVERNANEAGRRGKEILRLCYMLLGIQALLLLFFFVYGFFVPFTAFMERINRQPLEFDDRSGPSRKP